MFTRRAALAAGAFGAGLSRPALAQSGAYPARSIRFIVPYAAGGGQDISARLLADPLRNALGQAVIVENRSGASGQIGATATAQAAPDGYTIMLGGSGETAINQHLFRNMTYNPIRDLRPVMVLGKVPIVVMANPDAPFRSIEDLVMQARANPGRFSFSSSGTGNPQHLAGELFNHMAQVQTVHVPYRGSGPAVLDIASGQVQFGYNSLGSGLALIREGRIRVIGVTSRERMPQLSEVPAIAEYPPLAAYELVNFFGVWVPAATPESIVQHLAGALATIMAAPEMRARFLEQGLIATALNPEESRRFVIAESEKFGEIVRAANITAEG